MKYLSIAEKLADGVVLGDCWLWIRTGASGYGQMRWKGKKLSSHRVSYQLFKGPIPAGKEIDHLCGNRLCCKPEHLEAVDHATNVRRWYAKMIYCKRGHLNWYRSPSTGKRQCRTCNIAGRIRRRG